MIVEFRCDRERARQWMVDTTLPLENQDIGIQIAWAETATPSPAGLDALFELERMVLRKGKSSGADRLKTIPEPRRLGEPDVVVDFTTNYVVVGNLAQAAILSATGFVLGPFVYYGHEKAWDYFGGQADQVLDAERRLLPTPG